MKLLATILSIYLLGLTAVPCVDGETAHVTADNQTSEVVLSASAHDHATGEACAPFCSCQCCQIQLTLVDFPIFKPLNPSFQAIFVASANDLVDEFSNSLFQPPRV